MRSIMLVQSRLLLFLLSCVMIICTGCPYESTYPVSGNIIKYDSYFIGKWESGDADLAIKKVDDYTFSFHYDDHDDEFGAGEVKGTGYAVVNNGITYIVLESNKKFLTYKLINTSSGSIKVKALDEDLMGTQKTFSSAPAFTNYVNNTSAFGETTTFTRAASTSSYNNSGSYSGNSSGYGETLFTDYFDDNKNYWTTHYSFEDSTYLYVVTLSDPKYSYRFVNRNKSNYISRIPYTLNSNYNYSIKFRTAHQTDVYKVKDRGYGLKFAALDWDNSYALHIAETGYYRVSKIQNGKYSELVPWTQTSILNANNDMFNTLEVKVYTSYVDIYINNQYVKRVDNFVPFGAKAGFEVYNQQTIHFDDLIIRKLKP